MIPTPTWRGCDHFACRHGHGTPCLAQVPYPNRPVVAPQFGLCQRHPALTSSTSTEQITQRSSGRHFVTEPDGKR